MTGPSVVIPLHQSAGTIRQTLGCLLEQSLPPAEVIVVNDRSTDGGPAEAAGALRDAPFPTRFLDSDAGNAPTTRNLGTLAAGEGAGSDTILFLDADDLIAPDTLQGLTAALASEPRAGVAMCRWLRLEPSADAWVSAPASCRPRRAGEPLLSAWLRGWYHPPCSVLWRTAALHRTGGWDPLATVLNDGDLMMRHLVAEGDAGVVFAPRGCAFYRRPEGQTQTLSGKRATVGGLTARLRVYEKLGHRLEERGQLDAHRDALMTALHTVRQDAVAAGHLGGTPSPARRLDVDAVVRRFRAPLRERLRRRLSRSKLPPPPAEDPHGASPVVGEAVTCGGSQPEAETREAPVIASIDRPEVTVVIPVFNRPDAVEGAIRSVLDQPGVALELLVVDDASTDATAAAVTALAEADPRLRLLRQPRNAGVAAARNRGIREARGRVIALLDSDDVWLPDSLGPRLAALDEAPDDVAMVFSGFERDDGTQLHTHRPAPHAGRLPDLFLENDVLHAASNGLIRREAFATSGFFDESLEAIEDWELWIRMAKQHRLLARAEPASRYDDPPVERGRRSRSRAANLRAREQLFAIHGPAMLRSGRRRAAAFLLDTARRHLARPPGDADPPDAAAAERLALAALRIRPASREALRIRRWASAEAEPIAEDAP